MRYLIVTAISIILFTSGCSSDTRINKSIHVADGEHRTNSLRTVNGSITVGNEAVVTGNCSTVNGKISIGKKSQVQQISCVNGSIQVDHNSRVSEISCVNGSIQLGRDVHIDGDVSTVNGSINSDIYTVLAGNMETVNGKMTLRETTIKGHIETVNGHIDLLGKSIVKGDVIVNRENSKFSSSEKKELIITVDSGSVIQGNVEVKGNDAKVTVVLADGGEVLGDIINARIVRK